MPAQNVSAVDRRGIFSFPWLRWLTNGVQQPTELSLMSPPRLAPSTGTKVLTSGTAFAVYMGLAPRRTNRVTARYLVASAASGITWAEVALAKGSPVIGGNPDLVVIGYTDVAAVINSTGAKSTVIQVTRGLIEQGDNVWFIVGNSATGAGELRSTLADGLQVGTQASRAVRPSTAVGVAQSYTIESDTTTAADAALAV